MRLEPTADTLDSAGTKFQFHKGAIRTVNDPNISDSERHFNSIKVRLEHHSDLDISVTFRFQFHKGAIRT